MIHATTESPIGQLLIVGDGETVTGLYTAKRAHPPAEIGERDHTAFAVAKQQLREYFDGRRQHFELPLAPCGTPFQRQIWAELQRIDYGETVSYRDVAERIGKPAAVRAVGAANGRNPISIIVACHRVVGSDGSLTGYGGGLAAKDWLLSHEAKVRAADVRAR
jgi:methylated-DNA-[protein]-cysteine S-methyltransferase